MKENEIFTDLTISNKNKKVRLSKYFDSLKRNLPEKWIWLKDKEYDDVKTFFLINETIFLKTPYFKKTEKDLIFYGEIVLGLTYDSIILLDVKVKNLVNEEDLMSKMNEDEKIWERFKLLEYFSNEILKKNKYYKDFNHKYEFGAFKDENNLDKDIRDERSIKLSSKEKNKFYFLEKGKEAQHSNKRIIYFTPNNISLSLSLMKKSYKQSKKLLKNIFDKYPNELIQLETIDKPILYEYFESITTSVIFAYIAVESFANAAIPEDFNYEKINDKKIKEIWSKENIERWMPTSKKIKDLLPKILNTSNIVDEIFWKDFENLEQLRNNIVHQKTIDNGTELESELYNKLLKKEIFKIISSSISVIKFFYNYDNAHPYFPLGLGIAKLKFEEINDIEEHFGTFKKIE
ncbi:hypothetical protein [Flavobacterium sp. NRK F7]|uniref:hypothetical protein n=1 Tax=Flavobacterium sp. NRK F7 TaxID=2954930 RepID=UPI002090F99F|nr:hypothetical protein [Flavobacterium sp. NRK F7]MCO6162664.1 hypothetical protein [Flavobacterium sp. NRK F7]